MNKCRNFFNESLSSNNTWFERLSEKEMFNYYGKSCVFKYENVTIYITLTPFQTSKKHESMQWFKGSKPETFRQNLKWKAVTASVVIDYKKTCNGLRWSNVFEISKIRNGNRLQG